MAKNFSRLIDATEPSNARNRRKTSGPIVRYFSRLFRSNALEWIDNPSAYLTHIAQNLLIER